MRPSGEETRLLHVCDQNLALARAHVEAVVGMVFENDSEPVIAWLGQRNDEIVDELKKLVGKEAPLAEALTRAVIMAGTAVLMAGLIEKR